MRLCKDCGVSIEGRYHNALSCKQCTKLRNDAAKAAYAARNPSKARAAKMAYKAALRALRGPALCRVCKRVVKRPRRYCVACSPEVHKVTRVVSEEKRRKITGGDGFTSEQWNEVLNIHDNRCAYCLRRGRLSIDHVIAVSRGGSHDASNIVPACQSCNSRKGHRPIWVMVTHRRMAFRIPLRPLPHQTPEAPGLPHTGSNNPHQGCLYPRRH